MAKMKRYLVRCHADVGTIDFETTTMISARTYAENLVKYGVWKENKLYPPDRIVYIEVIDKDANGENKNIISTTMDPNLAGVH